MTPSELLKRTDLHPLLLEQIKKYYNIDYDIIIHTKNFFVVTRKDNNDLIFTYTQLNDSCMWISYIENDNEFLRNQKFIQNFSNIVKRIDKINKLRKLIND